jgi:hypothetical protein
MQRYRVGRVFASVVIWGGCIGVGLGVVVFVAGIVMRQMPNGTVGMALVLWGAIGALLGHVSRAVFDIADRVRGPEPIAESAPESTPIPLAWRDPG